MGNKEIKVNSGCFLKIILGVLIFGIINVVFGEEAGAFVFGLFCLIALLSWLL